MQKLIRISRGIPEGEVLNKWLYSRMIQRNQNALIAVTGGTGSGKSYGCHRIAELWYRFQFNKPYPVERNTCFSIDTLMMRLVDKDPDTKLRKGELLIFEEAGANFGSLDFQTQISKMFGYVLQSFRSMNIGILFNLPLLTMMNKSARMLLHAQFITAGIDYQKNVCRFKPFFRQVNQQTGKVYEKYLRTRVGKGTKAVKRMAYSLPSQEILDDYEARKLNFVSELNSGFVITLQKRYNENLIKDQRKSLTAVQTEVYEMLLKGYNMSEIARITHKNPTTIRGYVQWIKKKGYSTEKPRNYLEKEQNRAHKPIPPPISHNSSITT